MKAIIILAAMLLAAPSAQAEDAWTRLREVAGNSSANELCWDTARNFAREKHAGAKLGDAALTQVSLPNPVKESRKAFPGIRTC
jgi:hypothetical protein